MSDNQKWSILQGDALKVLGTFAPNTFDAVITDPPYASGGRTQTEKNKSTARKYSSMGENAPLQLIEDELTVGHVLGGVPADVPQVPLQRDMEQQQKSLRMKPEAASKLLALDLRKDIDLARSHFLHRLRLLGIDWGTRAADAQRRARDAGFTAPRAGRAARIDAGAVGGLRRDQPGAPRHAHAGPAARPGSSG